MKREKEIQAECNSCFMVNLVASFKDSAYLYMLLECIMGGELFTYLQVILPFILPSCFLLKHAICAKYRREIHSFEY